MTTCPPLSEIWARPVPTTDVAVVGCGTPLRPSVASALSWAGECESVASQIARRSGDAQVTSSVGFRSGAANCVSSRSIASFW